MKRRAKPPEVKYAFTLKKLMALPAEKRVVVTGDPTAKKFFESHGIKVIPPNDLPSPST